MILSLSKWEFRYLYALYNFSCGKWRPPPEWHLLACSGWVSWWTDSFPIADFCGASHLKFFFSDQIAIKPCRNRNLDSRHSFSFAQTSSVSPPETSAAQTQRVFKQDALRNISKVGKFLTPDDIKNRCIHAFVTSKVDFCNALLYGLPKYQHQRLALDFELLSF